MTSSAERFAASAHANTASKSHQPPSASDARIAVLGCGLIGTSVALALTHRGCAVFLEDTCRTHLQQAVDMGAGRSWRDEIVDAVVVATPPSTVSAVVTQTHERMPGAAITDVSSVKTDVMAALADTMAASRFVGGHPIAGGTTTGPEAAHASMFHGKPWAIVPGSASDADAVVWAQTIAQWCAAIPVTIDAVEHDDVLALTSHLTQVVSSALAGQLLSLPADAIALHGAALTDVTRLAQSDPHLWAEILLANSTPVTKQLHTLATALADVARALEAHDAAVVVDFLRRGKQGRDLLQ